MFLAVNVNQYIVSLTIFFLNISIEQAVNNGQDLRKKHEFRDQSWLGLKTRSRDPTLSRHKGININELYLHTKISQTATGKLTKLYIKQSSRTI